jgi:hypothetical protein
MLQPFIDLERTFVPVELDTTVELERTGFEFLLRGKTRLTWSQLFEQWRVIALAEPGAGKTVEFKAAKVRLQNEGKRAFFCPIETLTTCSIIESLEYCDRETFRSWLAGDEEAWFFLDSVDEARLESPQAFSRALRRFACGIESALGRVHVVISCRVGDWLAISDKTLVAQLLPRPNSIREQLEIITSDEPDLLNVADRDVSREANVSGTAIPQEVKDEDLVSVYQLAPLNWHQIQSFAKFKDVSNSIEFLDSIDKQNLVSFAERPQDLIDLIAYWQEYSRFGNYQEMIEFNIDQKLRETQPFHDRLNPLSSAQSRHGSECIAAAITFTRKKSILLPDVVTDPSLQSVSIQTKDILRQWEPPSINALLSRPIFDEALYGSVQFHHRSIREYLTARWLNRLLSLSESRQAIEALIFVQKHGSDVVAPSMRPIAAWMALWDDHICSRLCDDFPEVLLNHGDPASLDISVKEKLLVSFSQRYEHRERSGIYIESISIRRLACPELSASVIELVTRYANHKEICQILLRLSIEGEMCEALDIISPLVSDETMDISTRILAARAVIALGTTAEHQELAKSIFSEDVDYIDSQFVEELIPKLYPSVVNVDLLINVLRKVETRSTLSMSMLERNIEEMIASEEDGERTKALLGGLCDLLKLEPFVDIEHYRISQRYDWLEIYAIQCANKWIVSRNPYALDPIVLNLFLRHINGRSYHHRSRMEKCKKMVEGIKEWPEFCYRLFWYAFESLHAENNKGEDLPWQWWRVSYWFSEFWKPTEQDVEKLFYTLTTSELLAARYIALSALWQIYVDTGRKRSFRERLKTTASGEPGLQEKLQSLLHPKLSNEEKKWRVQDRRQKNRITIKEQKREDDQRWWRDTLPKWVDNLRNVENAERGAVFQSTWYLYNQLKGSENGSSLGKPNWKDLIPKFGRSVAEAFRDGCMRYWRAYDPFSEKDWIISNSISAAQMIGLTGLAIEANENLSWVSDLTESEATQAAHYSILELNGFPSWFLSLHSTFPKQVDEVIKTVFAYELGEDGHSCTKSVLAKLRWNDGGFQAYYQFFIVQILENNRIQSLTKLDDVLAIVFFNAEDDIYRKQLSQMLLFQLSTAVDTLIKNQLLCALMHVDATSGLLELKLLVSALPTHDQQKDFVIYFCANLMLHGQSMFRIFSPNYQRINVLKELVPFIYLYVCPEEDIHHEGIYSPGGRDAAQENRSHLISIVSNSPDEAAHNALSSFVDMLSDSPHKDYLIHLAEERAAIDAEFDSWQERDIFEFESRLEINCSDRSIVVHGNVINSSLTSGDHNKIK